MSCCGWRGLFLDVRVCRRGLGQKIEERFVMAEMDNSSGSEHRALPAKATPTPSCLPKITGLSTAFPMEVESVDEPASPNRRGDGGRQPRRHKSGQ